MQLSATIVLLLRLIAGCLAFNTTKNSIEDNHNHEIGTRFGNISLERLFLSLDDDVPSPVKFTFNERSLHVETNSNIIVKLTQDRTLLNEQILVSLQIKSSDSVIHFKESNSSEYTLKIPPNRYGDIPIFLVTNDKLGHAEISSKIIEPKNSTIDISKAYVSIDVGQSLNLQLVIDIIGWIYFNAWSGSFYYQLLLNYCRKSVVGLNFDFLTLNVLGSLAYTIYNVSMFFSRSIQQEYFDQSGYHRIPVELNDIFFSAHALLLSLVTVVQCFIYERENQRVTVIAYLFTIGSVLVIICFYVSYLFWHIELLNVLLCISYIRLVATLVKYAPQALMNFYRKSTEGWSIWNIILDFIGGLFSLMQMFMLAYNYNDWISIFGNFTKFGLGSMTICFDILFIFQHFVLYKTRNLTSANSDSQEDLFEGGNEQNNSHTNIHKGSDTQQSEVVVLSEN